MSDASRLEELREAVAKLKENASQWATLTAPNRPIDGFDLEQLREVAAEIIGLPDDDAPVLKARLDELSSALPNLDVNYDDDERELIVIQARLEGFKTSVLRTISVATPDHPLGGGDPDLVVVHKSAGIREELLKLTLELNAARADIMTIKQAAEKSASGVSVSLGPVSIELDVLAENVDEVLDDVTSTFALNLGQLRARLIELRDSAREMLAAVEKRATEVGSTLVAMFRQLVVATSEALVAGLRTIQLAFNDETRVDWNAKFAEAIARMQTSPPSRRSKQKKVWNQQKVKPWLKLSGAIENAARRLEPNLPRGVDRLDLLFNVGIITKAQRDGMRRTLDRLSVEMQRDTSRPPSDLVISQVDEIVRGLEHRVTIALGDQ